MKRLFFSVAMMLAGALAGCGTTDTSNQTEKCQNVMCPTGQTCNATSGLCEGTIDKCMGVSCTFPQACEAATGMCATPAMPSTSGALMDRMGRPAVNTALTNPFDLYKPQGTAETDSVTKDRYNKDGTVSYVRRSVPSVPG